MEQKFSVNEYSVIVDEYYVIADEYYVIPDLIRDPSLR